MADLYGALVGTPSQAVPITPAPAAYAGSRDITIVRDKVELAAAAATTTIRAAVVGWETVLDPFACDFSFDDMGTSVTLSLGNITYPNALCNAQDVATAAGTAKALKSVDINNYYKPLWEQLGYASLAAAKLIGDSCELMFKVNTAAATGTLVWQLRGAPRI